MAAFRCQNACGVNTLCQGNIAGNAELACSCFPGYLSPTFSGTNCTTRIGCTTSENGECAHMCSDSTGTGPAICSCNSGYSLNQDQKTCSPINSCLYQNGGCQDHSTCVSTGISSISCNCNKGYSASVRFNPLGFVCNPIYPCQILNGGCDQLCTSTGPGTWQCGCNAGYILNDDNSTCSSDIPSL